MRAARAVFTIERSYKSCGTALIREKFVRTYASVGPIDKMADLEGPGPVEKALGKDAMPRIMATAAKLIDSTQNMAVRTMPM